MHLNHVDYRRLKIPAVSDSSKFTAKWISLSRALTRGIIVLVYKYK